MTVLNLVSLLVLISSTKSKRSLAAHVILACTVKSNHPPRIIENIPKSINKRLSEISIDENSFNQSAPLY